jgi:DNA-binding MarR family transcriptional regulator
MRMPRIADADYRALAEFRYRIRHFLADSGKAALSAGLEPEQFQLLLAVKGMPVGKEPSIQALAERLHVNHNTTVERIDRLAKLQLMRRTHGRADGRIVLVELTTRGNRILEKLARKRMAEIRTSGLELIESLGQVIAATRRISRKQVRTRRKKRR